ncbi:MAG: RagB/SusD family nutrient uptake outer membrane protein [Bacteroides sp.]|nr:RagB/SusD family nutrient uptake outer membrane protein [Bacteroides sp.]
MDTDEAYRNNMGSNSTALNSHNITPSTGQVMEFWRYLWRGNECATNILAMLETVEEGMSEEEKNHIRGQAMVLQAFYHFYATQNWGPVPIKNIPTFDMGLQKDIPRSSIKEVCQFALDLCRDAIPLLKGMEQVRTTAQITQSAAEALSLRIALYMASHPDVRDVEKYELVAGWADEFIATGPHKLNTQPYEVNGEVLPAYARLFVKNMQDDQNWNASTDAEGIWDVIFFSKSNTSGQYENMGYYVTMRLGAQMGLPCADDQTTSPIGYADLTYRALNNLYNKYTDFNHGKDYPIGDLRRDWNIPTFCYKYKSNNVIAEGYSVTTRFPSFKVILPQQVTWEKEVVLLPIFNKETWNNDSGQLLDVYIEEGGAGYRNGDGETTFTVELPQLHSGSGVNTMGTFLYDQGGIIGYKSGSHLNTNNNLDYGHQNIQGKNNNQKVEVRIENGVITAITRTNLNNTMGSNTFPMVTERGIGKWRREYEVNVPPLRERDKTSCNFPILRFADVLLMASEAHLISPSGNKEKGLEYLNMVRRRAYGEDVYAKNERVDFKEYNLETVMDERSRELCFEGVRRFDLIR